MKTGLELASSFGLKHKTPTWAVMSSRVHNRRALGCFLVLIFLEGGKGGGWGVGGVITNLVMHNTVQRSFAQGLPLVSFPRRVVLVPP